MVGLQEASYGQKFMFLSAKKKNIRLGWSSKTLGSGVRRVNGKGDVEICDWLEQPKVNGDWSVWKRTRCKAYRRLHSQVSAESLSCAAPVKTTVHRRRSRSFNNRKTHKHLSISNPKP
ncbi:hypothetical protein RJT34_19343 [Clitoria ternatea]|uniref:Uncharacterized protein n=1 Tax=Clitoria ternatea TaxID=43366 RepID=A0AAN9IR17_CLITE